MSIINDPGKFEGEAVSTLYLYDIVQNGDGETFSDDTGGEYYTFIDGPFRLEGRTIDGHFIDDDDMAMVESSAGACLHESSDGFCSATWYETQEQYQEAYDDVSSSYADEDADESSDD